MKCKRCAAPTVRHSLSQRYCPTCEVEVNRQLEADARRRTVRFGGAKDLTAFRAQ